ncbi:amidohydrolase [Aliikangiella marina]|uniref:Amidohydrolase n=1 Tax=Aliikangiella marina TaxID=1712262 RepID=A0A545T117_9GAMM|nr:amidohydrolase [Aliikangiella marina]TQV70908.1 amidohydrolase [Aliikangiella marina]
MIRKILFFLALGLTSQSLYASEAIQKAADEDYQAYLKDLFIHFHQNPELSMAENRTAARIAKELKAVGFEVHTGVGKTGVVALLRNGKGPKVMMRADMDGLPVKEDSGLSYMSTATQVDPFTGKESPVMHACGHDVHITSLVGTGRYMAANKDQWSGTLMLIAQPAEERIMGARIMMEDNLWQRFGQPDYALAFHVSASGQSGQLNVLPGAISAGSNSVDIIIHGVGAHGASPHAGKDPIVLGSQIVLALQTLVARELPPKSPGVVTVGAFNSGFKHNIISDKAHLQLTVRSTSEETKDLLLNGIKRIAENMGRVAGLPEDKLPEVIISKEEATFPTINDDKLTARLRRVWEKAYGKQNITNRVSPGMGAEDFPYFTTKPKIPSVYWSVGGTPKATMTLAKNGGPAVPSHHSPFFKIDPDTSVPQGVSSTVFALMELMPKQ